MTQNSRNRHPVLVQAPVRALDPDGVAVIGSGTIAFAVGAVVCWLFRDLLVATGRGWYIPVSAIGTVLGLGGLAFGLNRRRLRGRPLTEGTTDADQADEPGDPTERP